MTYRLAGNDPTRTRDIPTPDEVRAMITGAGSDGFQAANRYAGPDESTEPQAEQDDEVMVWLVEERTMAESYTLGRRDGRCGSCGRKSECCCQGCPICPQIKMAAGKVSAAHAKHQVALGGTDPREVI